MGLISSVAVRAGSVWTFLHVFKVYAWKTWMQHFHFWCSRACGPATALNPTQHYPIPHFYYIYIFNVLLCFVSIFYYIMVEKHQRGRYWTLICQHSPMEKKTRRELAWEFTSQEESSPCTAVPREKRHSSALGRPHLRSTVPRKVLEAVVPLQLHVLLLRHSSLCSFSQGTAGPAWGQGAALLHPALPCREFPPLQPCWQQLGLCRGHSPAPGVDLQALGVLVPSALAAVVCSPGKQFPKCSSEDYKYKDSATCPVLRAKPRCGLAPENQKDFHCNVNFGKLLRVPKHILAIICNSSHLSWIQYWICKDHLCLSS